MKQLFLVRMVAVEREGFTAHLYGYQMIIPPGSDHINASFIDVSGGGGGGGGGGVENSIQLLNYIFWVTRVPVVNYPVSCCVSRVTTSKTAT